MTVFPSMYATGTWNCSRMFSKALMTFVIAPHVAKFVRWKDLNSGVDVNV